MTNKAVISDFNAIEENDTLTYDTHSISKSLKNFFSKLVKFLLIKLPNPPDKYNLQSVIRYYSSFTISDDFCLSNTSEEKVLKIITNIEKFKKLRLHIDKELYKKSKYDALKLILWEKQAFFEEKLSEMIGKPKELWESFKSLGVPSKAVISNFNAIEENDTLTYDTLSISKSLKNFFSNSVKSLLIKLPNPPDKYNLQSVTILVL